MSLQLLTSPSFSFAGDGTSTVLTIDIERLRQIAADIPDRVDAVAVASFSGPTSPTVTPAVDDSGRVITLTFSSAPQAWVGNAYGIQLQLFTNL